MPNNCNSRGANGVMSYVKINYRPKGELLTIEEKISKYNR